MIMFIILKVLQFILIIATAPLAVFSDFVRFLSDEANRFIDWLFYLEDHLLKKDNIDDRIISYLEEMEDISNNKNGEILFGAIKQIKNEIEGVLYYPKKKEWRKCRLIISGNNKFHIVASPKAMRLYIDKYKLLNKLETRSKK